MVLEALRPKRVPFRAFLVLAAAFGAVALPARASDPPLAAGEDLLRALTGAELTLEQRTYSGHLPEADEQKGEQYHLRPTYLFRSGNGDFLTFGVGVPIFDDQPYWAVRRDSPVYRRGIEYSDYRLRQSPQITADTGKFQRGHEHMSDMDVTVGFGRGGPFLAIVGFAAVLPTSEDVSNARDQYLVGPQLAVGATSGDFDVAARLTHLTRASGDRSVDTNETTLQGFFAWRFAEGLSVISRPELLYDWEGDSGNRLLLPVGGGLAGHVHLGALDLELTAEAYRFVMTADRFGADRLIRFALRTGLGF